MYKNKFKKIVVKTIIFYIILTLSGSKRRRNTIAKIRNSLKVVSVAIESGIAEMQYESLRYFFKVIAGRREKKDGLYFNIGCDAYTEKKVTNRHTKYQ